MELMVLNQRLNMHHLNVSMKKLISVSLDL